MGSRPGTQYRNCWTGLSDRDQVQAGLDMLEAYHWIKGGRQDSGGRTGTVYHIHPKALPAMLRVKLRTPEPAPTPVIVTPERKIEEKQLPVLQPREIEAPVNATGALSRFRNILFVQGRLFTSKMTTEAYARDPRFAAICLGYAYLENGALMSGWIGRDGIKGFLDAVDWANTSVLMHHAQFDGLILSHHYGIHPHYFLDTLSMARAIYPGGACRPGGPGRPKFGFTPKTVPYDRMNGVHPEAMEPALIEKTGKGAADDCELTLFEILARDFPTA
jgi:hypothetical protein